MVLRELIKKMLLILIMNFIFTKFVPKSWVSRAKTLLKRRKINAKSRPVSTKRLKEEQKRFNYAHEYKALQVQKQLDKRTYASQHINELIEDIFYPDITLAHEQAARIHLQSSTLQDHSNGEGKHAEINEKVLATDLIEHYRTNKDEMEGEDFVAMFRKFGDYFRKRDRIKESVERKWRRMNQTMKKKDSNYQDKKCPYLFIDRQDTFHYQPWNEMIEDLCGKFGSVQAQDQNFMEALIIFSEIVHQTSKAIHYVPSIMYDVFENYLAQLRPEQMDSLSLAETQTIIKSISVKKSIRLGAHHVVTSPLSSAASLSTLMDTKLALLSKLLSFPEVSAPQVCEAILVLKHGVLPFSPEISQKLKQAALKNGNLVEIEFERAVDLLTVLVRNDGGVSDYEFAELVKFDVLRKCPKAMSIKYLFKCMELVNGKHLQVSSKIEGSAGKIYGYDLLQQCANTLMSKYCSQTFLASQEGKTNILTYQETIKLANMFYSNGVTNMNLLEFLASEFVKLRTQMSLYEITDAVFKLFILGYKSEVLARVLFEEQKKRYHEAKKKAQTEDVKLLEGQTEEKPSQRYQEAATTNFQEVALEEDLILSLWMLFATWMSNPKAKASLPVSMDDLMAVYPLSIASRHPLIHECCLNLNQFTKANKILWQIKTLGQPKRSTAHIKNRLDNYYQYEERDEILQLMKLQASQSCQFQNNYHVGVNKFIPEVWSQANIYSPTHYIKHLIENSNSNLNYFTQNKTVSDDVRKMRAKLVQNQKKELEKKEKVRVDRQNEINSRQEGYKID